jgi:hypothetical protein
MQLRWMHMLLLAALCGESLAHHASRESDAPLLTGAGVLQAPCAGKWWGSAAQPHLQTSWGPTTASRVCQCSPIPCPSPTACRLKAPGGLRWPSRGCCWMRWVPPSPLPSFPLHCYPVPLILLSCPHDPHQTHAATIAVKPHSSRSSPTGVCLQLPRRGTMITGPPPHHPPPGQHSL